MAKKPTPKSTVKKSEPKTETNPAAGLVQGSKVNYHFTPEEMETHGRKPGEETISAEVVRVNGNEVVIKCEPRLGGPWQKGCFYNKSGKAGTWNLPG